MINNTAERLRAAAESCLKYGYHDSADFAPALAAAVLALLDDMDAWRGPDDFGQESLRDGLSAAAALLPDDTP